MAGVAFLHNARSPPRKGQPPTRLRLYFYFLKSYMPLKRENSAPALRDVALWLALTIVRRI